MRKKRETGMRGTPELVVQVQGRHVTGRRATGGSPSTPQALEDNEERHNTPQHGNKHFHAPSLHPCDCRKEAVCNKYILPRICIRDRGERRVGSPMRIPDNGLAEFAVAGTGRQDQEIARR